MLRNLYISAKSNLYNRISLSTSYGSVKVFYKKIGDLTHVYEFECYFRTRIGELAFYECNLDFADPDEALKCVDEFARELLLPLVKKARPDTHVSFPHFRRAGVNTQYCDGYRGFEYPSDFYRNIDLKDKYGEFNLKFAGYAETKEAGQLSGTASNPGDIAIFATRDGDGITVTKFVFWADGYFKEQDEDWMYDIAIEVFKPHGLILECTARFDDETSAIQAIEGFVKEAVVSKARSQVYNRRRMDDCDFEDIGVEPTDEYIRKCERAKDLLESREPTYSEYYADYYTEFRADKARRKCLKTKMIAIDNEKARLMYTEVKGGIAVRRIEMWRNNPPVETRNDIGVRFRRSFKCDLRYPDLETAEARVAEFIREMLYPVIDDAIAKRKDWALRFTEYRRTGIVYERDYTLSYNGWIEDKRKRKLKAANLEKYPGLKFIGIVNGSGEGLDYFDARKLGFNIELGSTLDIDTDGSGRAISFIYRINSAPYRGYDSVTAAFSPHGYAFKLEIGFPDKETAVREIGSIVEKTIAPIVDDRIWEGERASDSDFEDVGIEPSDDYLARAEKAAVLLGIKR